MNSLFALGTVLLLGSALTGARVADAQPSRGMAEAFGDSGPSSRRFVPGRLPTMVVLVDRAGSDTSYAILRNPKGITGDVILMNASSASGTLLLDAVLELAAVRERHGDTTPASATVRARGLRPSAHLSATETAHAERVIARIRGTRMRELPGIGQSRSGMIYLPDRSRRHGMRSARPH